MSLLKEDTGDIRIERKSIKVTREGRKGFDNEQFPGVLESQLMTYLGFVQACIYVIS
jgi:hypothetical protein